MSGTFGSRLYLTSAAQYEYVIQLPACLHAAFDVVEGRGYADFPTQAAAQAARLLVEDN
jgi:hypothetical protein